MIEISVDSPHFDALADLVRDLNTALARELRAANAQIGQRINREAQELLAEEIYSVPIPLKASANRKVAGAGTRGRLAQPLTAKQKAKLFPRSTQRHRGRDFRKWKRTGGGGGILGREVFRLRSQQEEHQVVLTNTSDHSAARAELGTPGSRRKAGVQRDQSHLPPQERSQTRPVGHWQALVAERHRDWIREQYDAAIARALERR